MFLSVGVGAEGFSDRQIVNSPNHIGFNGSLYIGKWFSAISGARIGASISSTKSNYVIKDDEAKSQMIMGLTADYLLDLTSLIPMKYHYDRIFDFSLYAGVGAYYSTVDSVQSSGKITNIIPGFRLGFNTGFRINQATTLFIEPGITLYGKGMSQGAGDVEVAMNSWRGFDIAPSLRVGLTYRVLPLNYRRGVSEFVSSGFGDNIFITYAGGIEAIVPNSSFPDNNIASQLGPKAQFGIGKWFSAASGARLLFNAGYAKWMSQEKADIVGITEYSKVEKLSHAGAQLDYLLNLNAMFGGYRPSASTGLLLIAGANVNRSEDVEELTGNGWSYGVGLGFQAYARITQKTNLFIEPRVNINSKNFAGGFSNDKYDISPSLMVGLTHNARVGIERRSGVYDNAAFQGWEFSVGAGAGVPVTRNTQHDLKSVVEPLVTANIAKWFNPYSGLRIDGRLGFMGVEENYNRTKFATLGLFYQLNLTNAMMGYDFNRLEVIPSIGPELMFNTRIKTKDPNINKYGGMGFGVSAGVKFAYNMTRQFGLYVEPRVGMYEDKVIMGNIPFGTFTPYASFTGGLVYKPYIRERREGVLQDRDADDNVFFTMGGGVGMILTNQYTLIPTKDMFKPVAKAGVGKWFGPVSGVKFEASAAVVSEAQKKDLVVTSKMVGFGLYYNANITNLLLGYDKHNTTEIVFGAGPEVYYTSPAHGIKIEKRGFIPGFSVSAQGIVNFNKSLGAYIEPRLGIYNEDLNNRQLSTFKFDPMAQVTAGIIWRMNEYNAAQERAKFAEDERSSIYVEYAAAYGTMFSAVFSEMSFGPAAQISLGLPYTPLSAVRFTARGQYLPSIYHRSSKKEYVKSGELEVDYVFNVANLADGVGRKWYDFNLFLGGIAGATLQDGATNFIGGVRVGGQAAVNFTPSTAIFVEPSAAIYSKNFDGLEYSHKVDETLMLAVGLKHRLAKGNRDKQSLGAPDQRSFVQIGAGTGLYARAIKGVQGAEKLTLNTEIYSGRWFNHFSGYRFGVVNNNVRYRAYGTGSNFNLMIFGLELDYMMNASNMLAGINKDRRVDLIGYVGFGCNYAQHKTYSSKEDKTNSVANFAASVSAGVQTLFKVTDKFGIYIEPGITVHQDGIDAYGNNAIKLDAAGKITLGSVIKF